MRDFLRHALDPVDRLGEVLFGLIMALGFTGAVRLGREEADNHELFISILGCNIAWGVVDGVMYVIGELFERGRRARLCQMVRTSATEGGALDHIAGEFGAREIMTLASAEERGRIYRWILDVLRREEPKPPRIRSADLLGGAAVALLIIACTAQILIPFLVLADPHVAVRVANAVGLAELFLLGTRWGRLVGGSPWRISIGLTAVGLVLVLITILLGG